MEGMRAGGRALGLENVSTEFVAYDTLGKWMKPDSGIVLTDRTEVIMTYALCGFSNFASIGIQIGGLGAMAPERQSDLARLGFRHARRHARLLHDSLRRRGV